MLLKEVFHIWSTEATYEYSIKDFKFLYIHNHTVVTTETLGIKYSGQRPKKLLGLEATRKQGYLVNPTHPCIPHTLYRILRFLGIIGYSPNFN